MRSTIRDLARAAGVSTATVDRALNGRAGVTPANRQRVLCAARDLGYLPQDGMVILPARPAHLQFFIPFAQNAFMQALIDAIAEFARSLPLVASCTVTPLGGIGPESLLPALESMSLRTQGLGLIAADHPRCRAAINALADAGVPVVTLASDIPGTRRAAYVGVDNRIAGRTAARLIGLATGHRPGAVLPVLGSPGFHGHREREAGFREVMERGFPGLRLLPPVSVGEDSGRSRRMMAEVLETVADLRGVYCIGAGRQGIVAALRGARTARPFVVVHDLTDTARGWLTEGLVDVVVDQSARAVAEQAVIRLLGSIAAGSPLLPFKAIEPRIILRENLPAVPG